MQKKIIIKFLLRKKSIWNCVQKVCGWKGVRLFRDTLHNSFWTDRAIDFKV